MKKLLSIIVVAVLSVGTAASAKGIQFEGVAGMNIANVDVSGANSRVGFHLGVRGTYAFQSQNRGLYANGAALLSLKGTKIAGITFNPYYLELPFHIGYKYPIASNVSIFGEFGPYFGIGLFGRTEGEDVFGDVIGYDRFDFGLGLRAGFEFSRKVNVSIGYDFGAIDIADGVSAKNRNLMISLGYKF